MILIPSNLTENLRRQQTQAFKLLFHLSNLIDNFYSCSYGSRILNSALNQNSFSYDPSVPYLFNFDWLKSGPVNRIDFDFNFFLHLFLVSFYLAKI